MRRIKEGSYTREYRNTIAVLRRFAVCNARQCYTAPPCPMQNYRGGHRCSA